MKINYKFVQTLGSPLDGIREQTLGLNMFLFSSSIIWDCLEYQFWSSINSCLCERII
jgi:hypothetical protein